MERLMSRRLALTTALTVSSLVLWGCPDDPTKSHDLGWIARRAESLK
jgi:hypothetical protein